jgi:hypothetical protein
MHKILLCFTIFLLFSCSSEKPAVLEGQKPSVSVPSTDISLEITPSSATRNSRIYAVPRGFALSDAEIEWYVNGYPTPGSLPEQFNTTETKKNDKVQAKATIHGKEILSNIIEINNSPPEISRVKILPEVFKPGDTLYVEASGTDIDGDEVTISYEWTKNGEPAGNSKQINTPLKKGDKIDIKITPYDGESYGRSIILHRQIANSPPVISENKNYNFNGNIYTYQMQAVDPDGDALTFLLKSAPSGMTVDSASGLIKWNVPPEFKGKAPFTVSVTDGHGGEALQSLTLEIEPEMKK